MQRSLTFELKKKNKIKAIGEREILVVDQTGTNQKKKIHSLTHIEKQKAKGQEVKQSRKTSQRIKKWRKGNE